MIIGSTLIKSTLLIGIITVFEVASVKLVGMAKNGILYGRIGKQHMLYGTIYLKKTIITNHAFCNTCLHVSTHTYCFKCGL